MINRFLMRFLFVVISFFVMGASSASSLSHMVKSSVKKARKLPPRQKVEKLKTVLDKISRNQSASIQKKLDFFDPVMKELFQELASLVLSEDVTDFSRDRYEDMIDDVTNMRSKIQQGASSGWRSRVAKVGKALGLSAVALAAIIAFVVANDPGRKRRGRARERRTQMPPGADRTDPYAHPRADEYPPFNQRDNLMQQIIGKHSQTMRWLNGKDVESFINYADQSAFRKVKGKLGGLFGNLDTSKLDNLSQRELKDLNKSLEILKRAKEREQAQAQARREREQAQERARRARQQGQTHQRTRTRAGTGARYGTYQNFYGTYQNFDDFFRAHYGQQHGHGFGGGGAGFFGAGAQPRTAPQTTYTQGPPPPPTYLDPSRQGDINEWWQDGGKKDWYYQVLGVGKKASRRDVMKAYKKKAMKYHPDKNPSDNPKDNESGLSRSDAEARFKDIANAKAALSDPMSKSLYDKVQAQKS